LLRGFGFAGIAAALVILLSGNLEVHGLPAVPVGAILVLLWARLSETPWSELGFAQPPHPAWMIAAAILAGILLKLVMKAVVMPLLGAPPVNVAFQRLTGDSAILPWAVWAMLVAGFSEEIVYRGFLFERLRALLGDGPRARLLIVVVAAVLFGLIHVPGQGMWGATQASVVALLFGAWFVRTRQLWPLVAAHASFDLTALTLIYFGVEAEVAGSIFG
jgi:uncharacterized protein